jgi:hypothetical protein
VSRPRFLSLRTRRVGKLNIFEDSELLCCALRGAGFGGLQSSLVRRDVFGRMRFESVAFFEDLLALIRAVALGVRLGYLDDVHVIVYSHDSNVSFAAEKQLESRLDALRALVEALERLSEELPLSRRESQALRANRAEQSFWAMGYYLIQRGHYRDGLRWMRYGLRCCPRNLVFWKTYLVSRVKAALA